MQERDIKIKQQQKDIEARDKRIRELEAALKQPPPVRYLRAKHQTTAVKGHMYHMDRGQDHMISVSQRTTAGKRRGHMTRVGDHMIRVTQLTKARTAWNRIKQDSQSHYQGSGSRDRG